MKKSIIICLGLATGLLCAQTPPAPLEIANVVSNYWFSNNLTGFSSYATNLYSGGATDYLPAVLVSAFHDQYFLGRLISSSNKLARVQEYASASPNVVSDTFMGTLELLLSANRFDMQMATSKGVSPVQMPATYIVPQQFRDETVKLPILLPHIDILYHTPSVTLP
jgi:hypothetical protein